MNENIKVKSVPFFTSIDVKGALALISNLVRRIPHVAESVKYRTAASLATDISLVMTGTGLNH